MATTVVFHQAALQALLRSPTGAVARDLARRAVRVQNKAKQNANGRPGPNVVSGRLWGSITFALGADAQGAYADIGTNVEYAIYLELGTQNMPPYPFLKPALGAASGL